MNPILAAAVAAAKAAPAATAAAKSAVQAGKASAPPVQIQQINAPAPAAAMHATWFQAHLGWLTHTIAGIFVLSALAVIILMAVQTTKQEGLSGTLGGRVESAYGRPGAEEQLKRITGFAATMFVICGTLLALTGI